jgi:DNA repair exonuclease SbcCD nuclease subunit
MNNMLLVGDPHLRLLELQYGRALLLKVMEVIVEKKPKYTVILGDVFHNKDSLSGLCLKVFNDFLLEASKYTHIICLVGNHDWCQPYSVHSLEGFKLIPNVTIVDDVFRLDDDNLFISYCREKERFLKLLKEAGPAKRLFGHLDVNSLTPGSGWEEVEDFMNPEEFSELKFEQIFSGHLHLAQDIKSKGTEIVMVGTGYTTDFGESDQTKRLVMLDLDTGKYESILTDLTLHKTLRIDAGEPFPVLPENELDRGVNFRLVIKGTREQISLIKKPKNYPVQYAYDWVSKEGARMDLSPTDRKEDTMNKYIEKEIERSFSERDNYNKEKLLTMGKKYLSLVNQK